MNSSDSFWCSEIRLKFTDKSSDALFSALVKNEDLIASTELQNRFTKNYKKLYEKIEGLTLEKGEVELTVLFEKICSLQIFLLNVNQ